jgi:hypothetical protein
MNDRASYRKQDGFGTVDAFEPEDDGDVHSACTAVAALPDSFLADLRRGKADDPTTARYKVLPETDLVSGDAPTLPPPPQRTRVQELNDTITAALKARASAPPLDVTPFLTPVPEEPYYPRLIPQSTETTSEAEMVVATPPLAAIDVPPRARTRDERWMNAVLAGIFVGALLASIATVVLAIMDARR